MRRLRKPLLLALGFALVCYVTLPRQRSVVRVTEHHGDLAALARARTLAHMASADASGVSALSASGAASSMSALSTAGAGGTAAAGGTSAVSGMGSNAAPYARSPTPETPFERLERARGHQPTAASQAVARACSLPPPAEGSALRGNAGSEGARVESENLRHILQIDAATQVGSRHLRHTLIAFSPLVLPPICHDTRTLSRWAFAFGSRGRIGPHISLCYHSPTPFSRFPPRVTLF